MKKTVEERAARNVAVTKTAYNVFRVLSNATKLLATERRRKWISAKPGRHDRDEIDR